MKESVIEFFRANAVVVQFAYGLAFFAMGLAIALESRRPSQLRMARHLPLLGTFGILQALASWGQVFIPIQRTYTPAAIVVTLQALHALLTALTFSFLMAFGARLLADGDPKLRLLAHLPLLLTTVWGVSFFFYPVVMLPASYEHWLVVSEAWSRYILAFPGAVLVALALARQFDELRVAGMGHLVRWLQWAIVSFGAYAVAAGLIVPNAGFFPSNRLNSEQFLQVTGLPVEGVRALTGLGMAYFMIRVMEMFDIEAAQRLEEVRRMRAILAERDRIARELHDGVIQSLYALGLGMQNARYAMESTPEASRRLLDELLARVNGIIQDVRGYIMDLRLPGETGLTLAQKLSAVAGEASRVYHLPVHLEIGSIDEKALPPAVANELSQVVKEAVSNAARHGQPRQVRVGVHESEGELVLYVQDDGRGFDPGQAGDRQGWGLVNMRRRAELLGGEFDIDSRPGEGTTVMVRIPLRAPSARAPVEGQRISA
ncbi:MAG: sensor histidine kinase [Limnochordaceae bacterium]|nr:sensor histidine kinase [Limnochordaceae bacterium]